jgi:glycosyltransferase involved in cell wall biosynthesis
MKIVVFSLYDAVSASTRVRLLQYVPALQEHFRIKVNYLLPSNGVLRGILSGLGSGNFFLVIRVLVHILIAYYRRILQLFEPSDLVIVYGELLPLFPFWLERNLLRVPYIYDLDDAFYLRYDGKIYSMLLPWLRGKINSFISGAACVTAGNRYLYSYVSRLNKNVFLIPSVVDTSRYAVRQYSPNFESVFVVGWIGSPSTAHYLDILAEPLIAFSSEIPLRFVVVGAEAPSFEGVDVVSYEWSLDSQISLIQQFDVGVMPLIDTDWARGKCAYKLIQYMACGIPVIASPIGANADVVPPGCGVLAEGFEQWLAAFRQLASSSLIRQHMGLNARRWVEAHYSLNNALPVLTRAIHDVVA